MGPKTKKKSNTTEQKQRKASARRQELLDAATEVVANKGIDGLTMATLAASMKVAVGVLYRYFANKQELVAALQHRALEEFGVDFRDDIRCIDAHLRDHELHGASDPTAALMRIITASHIYLNEGERSLSRQKMMNASLTPIDAYMSDELAHNVAQTIQTILGLIERLMLDAVVSGALVQKAPEEGWQRTYILWSHLHGLTHFRKRDRLLPPYLHVQALFVTGLTSLFLGWGAPRETVDAAFVLYEAFLGKD